MSFTIENVLILQAALSLFFFLIGFLVERSNKKALSAALKSGLDAVIDSIKLGAIIFFLALLYVWF